MFEELRANRKKKGKSFPFRVQMMEDESLFALRIKKSKTSLVETLKKTKLEEELSQKHSRNLSYSSPSFKKMLISQRFYFGALVQLVKYLILGASKV